MSETVEGWSAVEKEVVSRCRRTLEGNIVQAPAWAGRRGIIPAFRRYEGVWNWDAAFHAIAVSRWDAQLARDQFEIVWSHQQDDGSLPDVLWSDGRLVKEFGKPPVMPWAVALVNRRHPDRAFIETMYPKIVAYEKHWMMNRGGLIDGLLHYGGENPEWESGWDDAVRWDGGCSSLWCIDLNAFAVMMYDALIELTMFIGESTDEWAVKKSKWSEAIESRLWNEEVQGYMDFDYQRSCFTGVLTPASFVPLFAGTASCEHAEAMAGHAADPLKFYPGMPTVAYDSPQYSNDYMRGPLWFHGLVFAMFGLRRYGYVDLADQLRRNALKWVYDGGDPYEFYNSKTGEPGVGAAARFGWTSAFCIEMVEGWEDESFCPES